MLDVVPAPTPGWNAETACAGVSPAVFYPSSRNTEEWRPYCDACPVRVDCLAHSFHARENHGVWGGSDETDRERILRRLRRQTITWNVVASGALWPTWAPAEVSVTVMA